MNDDLNTGPVLLVYMYIGQSIVHNFLRVIIAYITLIDIFILTINIKLNDERN